MSGSAHLYFPALQFKDGERLALERLRSEEKDAVRRILTLPSERSRKVDRINSVIRRLRRLQKFLCESWNDRYIYVDFSEIADILTRGEVTEEIAHIVNSAMECRVGLRFVVDVNKFSAMQKAFHELEIPFAIRLRTEDITHIEQDLSRKLRQLSTQRRYDIFLDFSYIENRVVVSEILPPFVEYVSNKIKTIYEIMRDIKDSVIFLAGSFPKDLASIPLGLSKLKRWEWVIWSKACRNGGFDAGFGDYATRHPLPVHEEIRPELMNVSASIRYTVGDEWIILRGEGTRTSTEGYAQYHGLAKNLVESVYFRGEGFSYSDKKIAEIANKVSGPGNTTTWISLSVGHHISEVIAQLTSSSS